MEQEDENLLFRDLSSIFSYGVKVAYTTLSDDMPKVWDVIGLPAVGLVDIVVPGKYRFAAVPVEEIKPYLRPLSSMTEGERKEINKSYNFSDFGSITIRYHMEGWWDNDTECSLKDYLYLINWLNKHHFDCRGLIEKGLALEAPKGMYKSE
jgi:hypothetical protein